jgi:hypothetical protein
MECLEEFRRTVADPPVIAEKDQYLIKFALTEQEIESAFRLRYDVFNLEQGKGLKDSQNGIDKDEFDEHCLHLIVVRKDDNRVVGTYRIHFGAVAARSKLGFYSEQEYRIDGLAPIAPLAIEVGRTCVAPDSRNGSVVALLWSGISTLICRSGQRFLLGCVSLESTDPIHGWLIYQNLKEHNALSEQIHAYPRPEFRMEHPGEEALASAAQSLPSVRALIPPLFKGYLRLGAKICGEPVFDRKFGSIDFFIVLDVAQLPQRYSKHFNVELSAPSAQSGRHYTPLTFDRGICTC